MKSLVFLLGASEKLSKITVFNIDTKCNIATTDEFQICTFINVPNIEF